MRQEMFTDMEYSCRKKTKREESLETMAEIIPWKESIRQNLFEHRQVIGYITIIINHINRPASVCYIGSRYHDGVG